MNTLFENIEPYEATRIIEYNGRKFRMRLKKESSMPCAGQGGDWYHSLSIMVEDGTFKQITDAKEVGSSVSHYHCDVVKDFPTLCNDFYNYIKKVY